MVVYVCSAYGGKKSNIERAINYCLMEVELGNVPIAPHVMYGQMLDEQTDRETGIELGLHLLERSDALHVWSEITDGMRREIAHAESIGIPVTYMTE